MHPSELFPVTILVLVAAAGPAPAQGMLSPSSLHFWRLHQPESPFRDPDWMERLNVPEPGGRYGARNVAEAYKLLLLSAALPWMAASAIFSAAA